MIESSCNEERYVLVEHSIYGGVLLVEVAAAIKFEGSDDEIR